MPMSTRPAVAGRDQLVDRRVDRRVLAADAEAGEEAEHVEPQRRERERGHHRGQQIDAERDHEQLLAAEAVGQLAEDQGARRRRRRRTATRPGRRRWRPRCPRPRPSPDAAGDAADDRHLEPVEDPHRPQADDDLPVKARPRQAVQPRRDLGPDRAGLNLAAHRVLLLVARSDAAADYRSRGATRSCAASHGRPSRAGLSSRALAASPPRRLLAAGRAA